MLKNELAKLFKVALNNILSMFGMHNTVSKDQYSNHAYQLTWSPHQIKIFKFPLIFITKHKII